MDIKKFKELSFIGKVKWIVDYYGLTIFFAIIALLIAFNLVKTIVSPAEIGDVVLFIYSDDLFDEDGEEYREYIEENFGMTADISVFQPSSVYGQQALATKVGADFIDIIITPIGEMELLSDNAYLQGYEQIGDTNLYLGVTKRARTGEQLLAIRDYLEKEITEKLQDD